MLPLNRFKKLINPLRAPPWQGCVDCRRSTISKHIKNGTSESQPWDAGPNPAQNDHETDEDFHSKRVAYLVINPSNRPIQIDVGVPSLGFEPRYLVYDGNHRIAAAIYRRDEWLAVDYSGSVDVFQEMFRKRRPPTNEELAFYQI